MHIYIYIWWCTVHYYSVFRSVKGLDYFRLGEHLYLFLRKNWKKVVETYEHLNFLSFKKENKYSVDIILLFDHSECESREGNHICLRVHLYNESAVWSHWCTYGTLYWQTDNGLTFTVQNITIPRKVSTILFIILR